MSLPLPFLFPFLFSIFFLPPVFSSFQFQQITRICPLKCQCSQDGSSLACTNLSRTEVRQLFASGGTPSSQQFASGLLNLSIVHSQLDSMDILPRMERLLWLDLRGNALEKVGPGVDRITRPQMNALLRPFFPALIVLDLSQNLITSISRNSFMAFPNAEEIRLGANRIFSVDWEAFRLFRLRRLLLDNNHLLSISEHMLRFSPAIEELDLSRNQLTTAQSSSFFAAQRLRSLNLSQNRLQRFDYDSFAPLFQLESLDLSWNNFSSVPSDIRQFVALRVLNLSGNPIEKVAQGELVQPMLQTLQICGCPRLRLVERRAFAGLPNLQFLFLADNPRLQFVSPGAFQNNSLLFELDLSNNSLPTVDPRLLLRPTRVHLRSNPLQFACVGSWAISKLAPKLVDFQAITCTKAEGQQRVPLAEIARKDPGQCPRDPIVPFGTELIGRVGDFFSLYCAPRANGREEEGEEEEVRWILGNGTEVGGEGGEEEWNGSNGSTTRSTESPRQPITRPPSHHLGGMFSPVLSTASIGSPFLGGLHSPFTQEQRQRRRPPSPSSNAYEAEMPQQRPRVQSTGEQLRFEVLMAEDAGEYICRVKGADTRLRLAVHTPPIQLRPIEVGSHYVALVWNDSLKIRATERVQLSLQVRDAVSGQVGRVIQLSLHNPWHSYNVVRLRPLSNYSFCLVYALRHPGTALPLYQTCVDVQTSEQLGFWSSLSPTTMGILLALCFCLTILFCFRALYLRFYIWHEAKLRARMNQSMSGQSFLSHSSSSHQHHPPPPPLPPHHHPPTTSSSSRCSSVMIQSICSFNDDNGQGCAGPAQLQTTGKKWGGGRTTRGKRSRKKMEEDGGSGRGSGRGARGEDEEGEQDGRETEHIALC